MKEQELFDWLKAYHFKDLERSPNEYDGFDCMTKEFKLFIEYLPQIVYAIIEPINPCIPPSTNKLVLFSGSETDPIERYFLLLNE